MVDTDEIPSLRERIAQLEEDLADARENQAASKELEDELMKELEANETALDQAQQKQDLLQRDILSWKDKYQQATTEASKAQTTMQKEIDSLRETQKRLKLRLREVEVSNDEIERNERVHQSDLERLRTEHEALLEQHAMLESDFAETESLRADNQRLRDDLRDANAEISVLQAKITKLGKEGPVLIPSASSMSDVPSPPPSNAGTRASNSVEPSRRASVTHSEVSLSLQPSGTISEPPARSRGNPRRESTAWLKVQELKARTERMRGQLSSTFNVRPCSRSESRNEDRPASRASRPGSALSHSSLRSRRLSSTHSDVSSIRSPPFGQAPLAADSALLSPDSLRPSAAYGHRPRPLSIQSPSSIATVPVPEVSTPTEENPRTNDVNPNAALPSHLTEKSKLYSPSHLPLNLPRKVGTVDASRVSRSRVNGSLSSSMSVADRRKSLQIPKTTSVPLAHLRPGSATGHRTASSERQPTGTAQKPIGAPNNPGPPTRSGFPEPPTGSPSRLPAPSNLRQKRMSLHLGLKSPSTGQ
ncbi:NADH:ubiquinone oxidoreductase [Saitoella coloradoensis]